MATKSSHIYPPDTIGVKSAFMADERDVFRLLLGNQHTIERIFVRARQ
jgi:hypothetical protein